MICPNCGYHAKDTDKFCVRCATRLVPDIEAAVENAVEEAGDAIDRTVDNAAEEAAEAVDSAVEDAVCEINEAADTIEEAAADAVNEIRDAAEAVYEPEAPAAPIMPVVPVMPIREEAPAEPVKEQPAAEPVCECSRLAKPLTTWGFVWRILLFCIPILSMIPLFVMAFASGINKNSRSFARAVLIFLLALFVIAVCAFIYLLIAYGGEAITNYVSNLYNAVLGK